jgi:hypothetical protein
MDSHRNPQKILKPLTYLGLVACTDTKDLSSIYFFSAHQPTGYTPQPCNLIHGAFILILGLGIIVVEGTRSLVQP